MDIWIGMAISLAIPFVLLGIAVVTVINWRKGKPIKTWQTVCSVFAVVLWAALFIGMFNEANRSNHPETAQAATTPPQPSPPAPVAETKPVPPPPPKSPWTYHESGDALHDVKTKTACTTSTDQVHLDWPYGNSTAEFCIRKGPRFGLDSYVSLNGEGQILCKIWNCTVHVRFDRRPIQSFTAVRAADGSSNIIFLKNTSRLIDQLKKSSTVVVELEFYKAGVQTLTFDTAQLKWP